MVMSQTPTTQGTDAANTLSESLVELTEMLEADGATMSLLGVDEDHATVELGLSFRDAACLDCVMPPEHLRGVIAKTIERRTGRAYQVVLHDPRLDDAGVAAEVAGGARGPQMVEVLDPSVTVIVGDIDPGPPAGPLAGRTVGIRVDVLWRSFDLTVEEWTKQLEAAGAKVVLWRRTQGLAGEAGERAQASFEQFVRSIDVLISGLGNCGSCTSWSVKDALVGSVVGLPTTAVVTEQFQTLGRTIALDSGRPGLRLMVLPYPYDTLPEEEIRAAASSLYPQLVDVIGATV
jgi:Fe-S cluster biogenesis protein NfuA